MTYKYKIFNEELEKSFEIKYIFFSFEIGVINALNTTYDHVIPEQSFL